MPGPTRLIRTAIGLPVGVARRAAGLALRALPGTGDEAEPHPRQEPRTAAAPEQAPPDAVEAAERALDRDRERVEESAAIADGPPPAATAEREQEVVAESADVEATEPPGPQFHVDEPWEGYRRMRASEITARLEGQPAEVLATVELYESAHRKRRTVLDAVRATRA